MKQQHPESLASDAKRVKTGCGDMHVAVTQFENKPFEVFIALGKSGRCKNCMLEALGGLLSWGLRSGADIKEAADQLTGASCLMLFGDINKSCADAVGKVLE